jgi:energy-coupling factor transporter ATP-binding protein EcfA2
MVNLKNMGGGVEQLLILGCLLLHQKTSCILWEEPESHLHPGAQDVLLSELERLAGDSIVFLTTHSPVFIRTSEKIAVHTIRNPDGKSATGRTLSEAELQEAASIIGARPGHLAQADIVVYVEGPFGAAVVEEWIKKWPDYESKIGHLRLLVQGISPDELASDEYDLEKLKKVSPYMIIFVDKDNDEESEEPKAARKKLQGKCAKLQIPCIITKERQIENYLPEEYFERFWGPQLLENWKQEKKFTSGMKKHNREIAAAMDWSQIEKHKDIMKVFAEIVEYAKQLKP